MTIYIEGNGSGLRFTSRIYSIIYHPCGEDESGIQFYQVMFFVFTFSFKNNWAFNLLFD